MDTQDNTTNPSEPSRGHLPGPLPGSEEQLRGFWDNAAVGMVEADIATGRLLRVNPAFCQITGYPPDELVGKTYLDLTHPYDREANRAGFEAAMRSESPQYRVEKRLVRSDGGAVWVRVSVGVTRDGSGTPFRTAAVVEDITDRHRAQESLWASEERFRTLVQNITDYAIFTIDAAGYVTEWPEGAERVKGWRPDEIIGRHVSTFYTPEQVAAGCVERELKEAAETGRAEREDWRVRKGGERFWGNEIATAIRGTNGTLLGFAKISRDLSERKRTEDALREAEERHRLIVENARDYAIFMTDPEGRVVTWNTGGERIFGYGEAEIVGQDGAVLFTPEDRERGEHQKELATATGEGRASDDRWQVRKGGERFFASGVTTALRDTDGTLRGFVKVCRDLTERQRLEEQRERLLEQEKVARLEAERAVTMKDEFLAVVSHELRTPLSAILLWAKMLGAGTVKPQDVPRVVETIRQSADAQRQLIEDLLDVSRMISGKLRLNVREAELEPIVRAAAEAVRPMADARGVTVELSLDPQAGRASIDPDRVQQVVWNLLNNAVKFTDRGGRVSVGLTRLDGAVRIEVADTGRGISREFLPHVFERFRQADAALTRMEGGLGLGLSICHQLVELHGGTIRAESAGEGKGATFTVELPLVDVRGEVRLGRQPTDSANPAAAFATTAVLTGLRVLVVEDDANTREALQSLLESCGAEVTAVESAALAVAAFREGLARQQYDVLFSDIGMPVQDGYELIRELRAMERQRGDQHGIPAVALTAYAREEDRAKAAAAGFQAHVSKPVEPQQLIETVARLTRRKDEPE